MVRITDFQWGALTPVLILAATITVALIFAMGSTERWARPTAWVVLIGTLLALGFALWGTESGILAFGARTAAGSPIRVFSADSFTRIFTTISLIGTALTILLSMGYLERHRIQRGEYYVLMLLSTIGMILIVGANDLILIFLGIELLSLPLYVMAGFLRNTPSSEASLKYFLLGAFSSGFLLYGIAMIFGATGTTNLSAIAAASPTSSNLFRAGLVLLLVGLGFKVAAVPFHQWAPDVYEGSPTSVTAFFASAPKVAAFGAILRIFFQANIVVPGEWQMLFAVLAALTMTVGNLIAITQRNVKRMLAYSSIAHAGYVLVALAAGSGALNSAIFYLFVYTLMSIGAFGVLILRGDADDEHLQLNDYAGLGFRRPVLAGAMTVFLLSLAGFPPTAGFIGKFLIFRDAYDAGLGWLVILGVLNSVASAFYYLGVVVKMYMAEPTGEFRPGTVPGVGRGLIVIALLVSIIGVLLAGVLPSRVMPWVGLSNGVAVRSVPDAAISVALPK